MTDIVQLIAEAVRKALPPETLQRVGRETIVRDRPNAPSPDEALHGSGYGSGPSMPEGVNGGMPQMELAAWRAPMELRGSTIHTSAGMMQVPSHGIVHTRSTDDHDQRCNCAACGVNKELAGRGFRRQQSKKSASEIVEDDIRAILKAGAAKGQLMDHTRHVDKTGSLAAEVTRRTGDVDAWLHARAMKNSGEPVQTSYTPKAEYIKNLRARGYSLVQAERIADGKEP